MNCHCGSEKSFNNCCLPFIELKAAPETPEQLMRSRFSAYCVSNYQYILDTYASQQRQSLSLQDIESSAEGTRWTALSVCSSSMNGNNGEVEFKAYYRIGSSFFVLHEASKFIKENVHWRYTAGDINANSGQLDVKRNTPCPCKSQLKYKRCCGK